MNEKDEVNSIQSETNNIIKIAKTKYIDSLCTRMCTPNSL